ncbi:hypothetical protein JAAARDRAFT_30522 [Jaapia argillacea MUCL 33604]|uniref:Rad60/SUMO-like domain-containing protein n=1 Tax=Jaapia argillacea MUCL 33604 TaxID=933084 RepID=A0A067Q6L3_9AGAM|nr:hypothetical protein JAAARDRAFT_30522 [Jaapia argillacea MUCL 33604]
MRQRRRKRELHRWTRRAQTPNLISSPKRYLLPEGGASRSPRVVRKCPSGQMSISLNYLPLRLSSGDEAPATVQSNVDLTPNALRTDFTQKRKRARSRSRSITPPPPLSLQQRQRAHELVRQALDIVPRAPSPTSFDDDDSTDTIVLDPELASIAREVKSQSSHTISRLREVSLGPELIGGPEAVIIKVHWLPHPLDDAGRRKTWGFKLKRHDSLEQVFEETADEAAILSDNLVMRYDRKRVFSSATPHSLGIWAEAELEACEKTTYEYLRTHNFQTTPSLGDDAHLPPSRTRSPSLGAESEAESESGDAGKFKLIVRGRGTKEVSLTVKPTATCGAIVRAFLKSAGLSDKFPESKTPKKGKKGAAGMPRLVVDGERMSPDSQIGEADLEDGDMVEVDGL